MTIQALYIGQGSDQRLEARPWEHAEALHDMMQAAIGGAGGRVDSDGSVIGCDGDDAWREFVRARNGRVIDRFLEENPSARQRIDSGNGVRVDSERADAFSDAGGAAMARDLDYVHRRVLEERAKPLNAFRLFRTEANIPVGARTHTVRRFVDHGEAGWYRGGNRNISNVGYAQKEEQFPVRYIVTSVRTSIFQMMSTNLAGINDLQRKMRVARRAIDTFANAKLFSGDEQQNYYGVLTYPYLAKKVVSTSFNGSAAAADVLSALNSGANYPGEQSGGAMMPNRMVTSIRVRNYLMQTQFSAASDATIGEIFLRNNPDIRVIEQAHELKDAGGTGVDGVLFYNDDADSVCHETAGGLQVLPQQSFGFDNITYMFMATGGIVMRDAGNNILLLVTAV